jgi:2-hydroxymuconate-semialdehyde hydrolase
VRANLPLLKKHFRVVAFDLPGFGKSEEIEGCVYENNCLLISALMDYLGVERFHIMGFCLGSLIALDYSLQHQARIKSMVLIDIVLSYPVIMRLMNVPVVGKLLYRVFSKTSSGFSAFLMFVNNRVLIGNAGLFDSIRQTRYSTSRMYVESMRKNLSSFTKSLTDNEDFAPCLILTSSNTLKLFYKDSLKMHRMWKSSQLIVMKNCGHYIQLEKPKALCQHVTEFVTANA